MNSDELESRSMSVKILYTFDKLHTETCLTRLSSVPIRATDALGVVDLYKCIKAAYRASPELAASDHDFAVYSTDYSEPDEPLVGHGMCSTLSASSQSQSQNHIIGRVCKNAIPLFSSSESLQVRLRFTPMTKLSSIATDADVHVVTSPTTSDHVSTPHNMGLNDIFDSDQLNRYLTNSPPHRARPSSSASALALGNSPTSPKALGIASSTSININRPPCSSNRPPIPTSKRSMSEIFSPKAPLKIMDLTTHDTRSQSRARRIERELIHSLKIGAKPTYCENCGTLRTSTWRKCDNYNLCNPCGLWYKNKNSTMRPKSLWQTEVVARPKKRAQQPEVAAAIPISRSSPPLSMSSKPSLVNTAEASSTLAIDESEPISSSGSPLRDRSPTPSPKRRRTSIKPESTSPSGPPRTPPQKSRSFSKGKENVDPHSAPTTLAANTHLHETHHQPNNNSAVDLHPSIESPLTPRKTARFDEMFHEFFESSPSRRMACLPDLTFSMDSANMMSSEIAVPSSPPFFFTHDHEHQESKKWKSPIRANNNPNTSRSN